MYLNAMENVDILVLAGSRIDWVQLTGSVLLSACCGFRVHSDFKSLEANLNPTCLCATEQLVLIMAVLCHVCANTGLGRV